MNKLFPYLVLLFSASAAYADCPNLAGKYSCSRENSGRFSGAAITISESKFPDGSSDILFSISFPNHEERERFWPDGVERGTEHSGYRIRVKESCENSRLYRDGHATNTENGKIRDAHSLWAFGLSSEGNLKFEDLFEVFYDGIPNEKERMVSSENCRRTE